VCFFVSQMHLYQYQHIMVSGMCFALSFLLIIRTFKYKTMVFLEIIADIERNKMLEFNQSKMTFINDLQTLVGYVGFTELPGKSFDIKISWENKKSLDSFMKSELYKVFRGAVITLSKNNDTTISLES